jgi:hypothetical protein
MDVQPSTELAAEGAERCPNPKCGRVLDEQPVLIGRCACGCSLKGNSTSTPLKDWGVVVVPLSAQTAALFLGPPLPSFTNSSRISLMARLIVCERARP